MEREAFKHSRGDRVSNQERSRSSKNDLYQRVAREREQSQKHSVDVSSKNGTQMGNKDSNALLKNVKDKVERTRDTSTVTSTEPVSSKHTQPSGWGRWLKTAFIATLAVTVNARDGHADHTTGVTWREPVAYGLLSQEYSWSNNQTSRSGIGNDHGTMLKRIDNLTQQFKLRGVHNWSNFAPEKKGSEKITHYRQKSHGRNLLWGRKRNNRLRDNIWNSMSQFPSIMGGEQGVVRWKKKKERKRGHWEL